MEGKVFDWLRSLPRWADIALAIILIAFIGIMCIIIAVGLFSAAAIAITEDNIYIRLFGAFTFMYVTGFLYHLWRDG